MSTDASPASYPASQALLQRARQVIPTGVWGHNRYPAFLSPGRYPVFAHDASGARFRDVDGREYIDYLCGYGAMISGFANPLVDGAAAARMALGDCLDHPTETSVLLAERLVGLVTGMAWVGFGKNGSDAISTAFLIARARTGRRLVVCAEGAYHGSHSWCNWCNMGAGRPRDDSSMVLPVPWNDLGAVRRLFEAQGESIAAVLMTPFHHPIGSPAVLPDPDWWPGLEAICRGWGAQLIVDDVRAGFRLDLRGSHHHYGFTPDLVCFSKALANTHSLSAVMGTEGTRDAAGEIFAAGTFWSASAPMAAALANLDLLEAPGTFSRLWATARALCDGLMARAAERDLVLEVTGPATMPTVTFADDPEGVLMNRFAEEMVARGSFVHPSHNWFVSAAHGEEEITRTLEHASEALDALQALARPASR